MEHAARLMVLKNLAARQAAEACGYASDAAFGRAFRQHFGVTPKAYRVQARARLEQ
jgi:AraC family transcriptional activator of mtrCDE